MPRGDSARARRTSSLKWLLPPSMIVSPDCSCSASAVTVCSVGSPAGTMSHTARGGARRAARSASDEAPVAPLPARPFTASVLRSHATTSWPPAISRRAMLPPMRPRPIRPICMARRSFCMRAMWRPPSKGVVSQTRTIASASASVIVRWPSDSMLASLCARFQTATCSFQHSPHRIPQMRLATIASPLPEPPRTMPRSNSPRATASATGRMKSG